jgi:calcium-dependent protein kinase
VIRPTPTMHTCQLPAAPGLRSGLQNRRPARRAASLTDFGFQRSLEKDLELGAVLGAGAYGVVRAAVDRRSGQQLAVKTIPKTLPRGADPRTLAGYLAKIHSEVDTHFALGHSLNVVTFHGAYEDDKAVHIAMELCTGGTLWHSPDLVGGRFSEEAAARIMRSVLRTIAQCHAKGVCFRDVKPENYLFQSAAPGAPLKLSDFGLAARCRPGQILTERCGTLAYMAPEVVSQRYSLEADLWSAGVMAYQLLTGRLPFTGGGGDDDDNGDEGSSRRPGNAKAVFRSILFDVPDLLDASLSPAARDFIRRLIGDKDPRKRMGVAQALEHVWVREDGGLARTAPLDGTVIARLQRFGTTGALQRAVLRAVAASMPDAMAENKSSSSELAAVEALFDSVDVEHGGILPRQQLVDALSSGGYALSADEWSQLLDAMDTKNSGRITRADFVAALLDWRCLAADQPDWWASWAATAFTSFAGQTSLADDGGGIEVDALLDEVCDVSWDLGGGAVCRHAVEETLSEVAGLAPHGKVTFDAWMGLLNNASSEEDLIEFDARLR